MRLALCVVAFCALILPPLPAFADDPNHNSRPLTADEMNDFLSLSCEMPARNAETNHNHCAKLEGYSYAQDAKEFSDDDFGLIAISYGGFTKEGADQAYVTYTSSREPHATNFGGGLLFERVGNQWKLDRWLPGGQMARCVALPGAGPQKMLCADGYMAEGEHNSWLAIYQVPEKGTELLDLPVMRARDMRGAAHDAASACHYLTGTDAVLLSLDDVHPALKPGYVADVPVTYAARPNIEKVCGAKPIGHVKETKGVVHVSFKGKLMSVDTPLPFEETAE